VTALVQNTIDNLSFGVLHDSRACLSNAAGQGVHLNDESRDDDSNAFTVLSSVSVEREAGASAAEQFDLSNPVDVNIRDGHRLDRVSRQFQMAHYNPRCLNGVNVPNFGTVEKNAALSFYRLNKIWRAFYRNLKGSTSTSFPNSIRGSERPNSPALIREREMHSPCVSRTNSCDANSSLLARHQLASDGFVVIARSLIPAREQSLRFNFVENPTTDSAEALPRFVGVSVIDAALHAGKQSMENSGCVQIPFTTGTN
jgi:hypothetical protein